MIKQITILFVAVISYSLTSCEKESSCKWFHMPHSLRLRIFKSGIVVSHEDLRKCSLTYFERGTKKYISDFSPFNVITDHLNKGLISTRSIGRISADSNIKTYYIECPNGWTTDTLYVDYLPRTPKTNCLYLQNEVKVNTQSASVDISLYPDFPTYIVDKP
jgi:hypothetical protein